MKRCSTCKESKPREAFYRHRGTPDGLAYECAECVKARARKWSHENRERARESARAYYQANKDKWSEAGRRWREANPEKTREGKRKAKRLRRERDPEGYLLAKRIDAHRRKPRGPLRALTIEYGRTLLRDPCSYCGAATEQIDHIVAVVEGGDIDWTNLTAACLDCNSRKHRRSLLTFLMEATA